MDILMNYPINYTISVKSKAIVKIILDQGIDVNFMDIFNYSPIMDAVYESHFPVVKLLVDAGAEVNVIVPNFNKKFRYRWRNEPELPPTPPEYSCLLIYAIELNNLSIVKYLIEHGATYDFQKEDYLDNVLSILFHVFRLKILDYLLDTVMDIQYITMETLSEFLWGDRTDITDVLFKHGMDIELVNKEGETLLVCAIKRRKSKIIKYLLEKGVQLQPIYQHLSALDKLIIFNESEGFNILKMLVKHGLELNRVNLEDGETLLTKSIRFHQINVIKYLLEKGADPFYVNTMNPEFSTLERVNEFFNFQRNLKDYKQIHTLIQEARKKKLNS